MTVDISSRIPSTVRIDATTKCQLRCAGCKFQQCGARGLGYGHLSFCDFKSFIDANPQILRIELSNFGEIFLNPELVDIMEYAYQKGVSLEAAMGVNFNTVSDEQMQALVDYKFRFLSISIDGAAQESYAAYRVGGNYEKVIGNIRKLQKIKNERNSIYPKLQWQFIPNEFNEDDVIKAREIAEELEIPIIFKLNYIESYSPNNPKRLKRESGLAEVTRKEYLEAHHIPYLNDDCLQVFTDPQFNWDGSLLGCCRNAGERFSSNLFRDGLEACLSNRKLLRMRQFLLRKNPDPEKYRDIPCSYCNLWKDRNAYDRTLDLVRPNAKTRFRPDISVIVPMYNCENYVDDLLTSLSNQTFNRFEVICVDDGSTDSTAERIKKFCRVDSRFNCISKENAGAGTARNVGIDAAEGRYLMFLDADDLYHRDLLMDLYIAAEKHNADQVMCQFRVQDCNNGTIGRPAGFAADVFPHDVSVATEGIDNLYSQISDAPWFILFRKSLIDRYKLRFSGTKTSNDAFFVRAYASVTKTIVGLHRNLVTYRAWHNPDSLSAQRKETTEDAITYMAELYSWLRDNLLLERYGDSWQWLFFNSFTRMLEFPYNPRFVEAFTEFLFENERLKNIDSVELYVRFWHFYDPQNYARKINLLVAGGERRPRTMQKLSNNFRTAAAIERIAITKYNRPLNPYDPDSPEGSKRFPVRVSVIIPVFNAEECLERCIESLVNQTIRELEFIFVDDGSTDGSADIIRRYRHIDKRIILLQNEENMGAGFSRNRGIEVARGEYLSFVDADDRVSPDCYELLYKRALETHMDIIKGKMRYLDENGEVAAEEEADEGHEHVKAALKKGMPLYWSFRYDHQSAIYARPVFDNESVRYGNMYSGQDGVFLLNACLHANGAATIDNIVYYRYRRLASLSDPRFYKHHMGKLESLNERILILKERGLNEVSCNYIIWYANYCLDRSKYYFNGRKKYRTEEMLAYLELFDRALDNTDCPDKVTDALISRYWRMKRDAIRSKHDGENNSTG